MHDGAHYQLLCSRTSETPLTAVRGVLLLAGRRVVRERGLYARYEAMLPAEVRPKLDALTATDMIPMETLLPHEVALDGLGFSMDEARAVGCEMSRIVNGAVYSTIVRLTGKLGASPWLVFSQAPKTWARLYRGGAVAVYRCGDRSARVEVSGDPLARFAFHREAFSGALFHIVTDFCDAPVMHEIVGKRNATSFAHSIRW